MIQRVAESALVTFSHLGSFSSLRYCSSLLSASLCLQLEAQAHFVAAAVHVLPVEQAGEGELHSWGGRGERTQDFVLSHCSFNESPAVAERQIFNQLTWPEGLCVSNSNQAGVVNFSLEGETK